MPANVTEQMLSQDGLISMVTVVSLAETALFAFVAIVFASWYKSRVTREDYWVLVWLVYDILIHFFLEGPFVVISLISTVDKSNHTLALTWKEYAKADRRWGVSDPTIVSLEILTTTIVQVFAVLTVYGIIRNKFYRHYVQICLCVCELYGGWMTFCPEWLTGSKALSTDNFLHLWVYLVFFNCLWVVIPLYLMWQSWEAMRALFEGEIISEKQEKTTVTTLRTYHTMSQAKKLD